MMATHRHMTDDDRHPLGDSQLFRLVLMAALVLAVIFVAFALANAQMRDEAPETIDAARRTAVVDSSATLLENCYVFPEMGKRMANALRKNLRDGDYDAISAPDELARRLSDDIIGVSNDLHLGIRYAPNQIEAMRAEEDSTTAADERERQLAFSRADNFAFRKIERLDGNIGYIKFDGFSGLPEATEIAGAAMKFVSGCDALIFDLRDNGGGSPAMIQYISSYLFDGEARHLNSFYERKDDTIVHFHTYPHIIGGRLAEIPVYVLTSDRTFSAAEEFTYNLKHMGRATIVGDTTGGGAHPVDFFVVDDGFAAKISIGRAINPITHTNWEGVGVIPHLAVDAGDALDAARLDALKKMLADAADDGRRQLLSWKVEGLEARLNPVTVSDDVLQLYVGNYGPRKITLEDGALYYQREDRPKYRLTPMGDAMFCIPELEYFRLQFVQDGLHPATEVVGLYDNGYSDRHGRGADNP